MTDATAAATLTGTAAELKAVADETTITTKADAAITVTDAANAAVDPADLTAVAAMTTGAVTVQNAVTITGDLATVSGALADNVTASSAAVTLSAGTISDASALSELADKVGSVDASAITAITGSVEDVKAIVENTNVTTKADVAITLNDDAGTEVAAAALKAINDGTTGAVTFTNAVLLQGALTAVNDAIDGLTVTNINVQLTDATITATALNTLDTAVAAVTTSATSVNGGWSITGLDDATVAATASIDTFVLGTAAHSGTITGFASGTDKIGLGGATGTAAAVAAVDDVVAATTMAKDTTEKLATLTTGTATINWAYNTTTNQIMYDADGDWTDGNSVAVTGAITGLVDGDFIIGA